MYSAKCKFPLRIALVAALLAGCASNLRESPTAFELEDSAQRASQEYLIGPRDRLTITVWRQPDLSAEVEVRLDGKISVPLLDDIVAADRTALELKDEITRRLSDYVVSPRVTVVVSEIQSKVVYMMGEITTAGAFPYSPQMRVIDAISLAGGFSAFSGKNRIKVIRRRPDGTAQEFLFNYDTYIKGTNLDQNILLLPGDRIVVPEESPFLFR